MYQNINSGDVWKLSCVETIRTWRNEIKVYLKIYVFENGERWAEDLFIKHWRKVDEAEHQMHLTDGGLPVLKK